MRKLFNLIKIALRKADSAWIKSVGHEVLFIDQNATVYGLYQYPTHKPNVFGVDDDGKLEIQFSRYDYPSFQATKEGVFPLAEKVILVENQKWIILSAYYIHHAFMGKYRIGVICSRYEETKE